MKRVSWILALIACAISVSACIFISRRVEVQRFDPQDGVTVTTPVKAHLKDGTTVTYPNGVRVSGGMLRGEGLLHDIGLTQFKPVQEVALDTVLGMESFRTRVNGGQSAAISTLATVGGIIGGAALVVAIFGSCPTVYSDGNAEEAELFSSSIVPLFEARDVDRLRAQADTSGTLRLEIRNEALETHYVNHLQILEIRHDGDEFVLPETSGGIVAVRDLRSPRPTTDRAGRNLEAAVNRTDDDVFATDPQIVDKATVADMNDWIDFSIPAAASGGPPTLVLRLRNSLLSTTLLYDVMLKPSGARALDWLNRDLTRISTAVELGRWHQQRAGLHVQVWKDGDYKEVARIPDTGPISWHDVAVKLPSTDSLVPLRVRLSFLADHWRIDRIGVAGSSRVVNPRVIPIARVRGTAGREEELARENMMAPDDRYLQTSPGQRFFVEFDAGKAVESRTFLLSSQGYYTEWIRGSWIQTASGDGPFAPTDESLITALRQWSHRREAFEKQFREARVPVK